MYDQFSSCLQGNGKDVTNLYVLKSVSNLPESDEIDCEIELD